MNQAKISVAVLAASAGFACSIAVAGGPQGVAKGVDRAGVTGGNETVMGNRTAPAPKAVQATIRHYAESEFQTVDPVAVYVNGRSVPFTVSDTGNGSATDSLAVVTYENWISTGTGTSASTYTATISGNPISAVFDNAVLGSAGANQISSMRLRFATSATINTATNIFIGVQWYDGFNSAGTPVNTALAGTFIEKFAAPTTGWATSTVYRTRYVTSSYLPLSFTTAGSNGGFEWLSLNDDGSGNPDVTALTDVNAVFNANVPTVGSSTNGIYFNNNVLDANGNGQYNGPAITFVDSSSNPVISNVALGVSAFVNAGASYTACCLPGLPGGGCVTLQSSVCTAQGGVSKSQTDCNLTISNQCSGLASGVIFNNGPLSTGTTVTSNLQGSLLAAGQQWSEIPLQVNANPAINSVCTGNIIGAGILSAAQRTGDDFTVPAGESWTVSGVRLYTYLSGGASTTNPIATATVALWKGFPDASGSVIVAGDNTTPITPAATSAATGIYRAGNTIPSTTPGKTRLIWGSDLNFASAVTLAPGHYYVTWNVTSVGNTFQPLVSISKQAAQYNSGTGQWTAGGVGGTFDTGNTDGISGFYSGTNPGVWGGQIDTLIDFAFNGTTFASAIPDTAATCLPYNAALPFSVLGSKVSTGCYANCDGSTGTPALTAADFTCFLTKFRASDSYANCDGSTGVPSLTAADFTCFLTKFRAGCS